MTFTLQRKHLTIVQIHKVYELKAVSERVSPFLLYRKDLVTLKCERLSYKEKTLREDANVTRKIETSYIIYSKNR